MPLLKLTWLTSSPVWVDQWPLKGEKLQQAEKLVEEQLKAGHIVPSTSPWNAPIFVIPKKSGKWRLLQNLQTINAVIQPMGALQLGVPNPTMIPTDWLLYVIDLKDCFFTIPLHPDDCMHFAFSLPSINNQAPMKCYQWTVLPQGMMNSLTIRQIVVAAAIEPTRKQFPKACIYRYVDDILLAASDSLTLHQTLQHLLNNLELSGLQVVPEKVQSQEPWKYLGWTLFNQMVQPTKLHLAMNIRTLHDAQKSAWLH